MRVGQTVYVKNLRRTSIEEDIITKIGHKYFYLKSYPRVKFLKETKREYSEFTSDYKVYLDKEEIELENKTNKLKQKIGLYFRNNNLNSLTLTQLSQIENIIWNN